MTPDPNYIQADVLVDFDRTLSTYSSWDGPAVTGEPILPMVVQTLKHLSAGHSVAIFTARVDPAHGEQDVATARKAISDWCLKYLGCRLPITCAKSMSAKIIYDDRAVSVVPNTGRRADGKEHSLDL